MFGFFLHCVVVHLCAVQLVDSNDEMKKLKQINRNNFARLPRAKKELSDQMATAVCQFLATCMNLYLLPYPLIHLLTYFFGTKLRYSHHSVACFDLGAFKFCHGGMILSVFVRFHHDENTTFPLFRKFSGKMVRAM